MRLDSPEQWIRPFSVINLARHANLQQFFCSTFFPPLLCVCVCLLWKRPKFGKTSEPEGTTFIVYRGTEANGHFDCPICVRKMKCNKFLIAVWQVIPTKMYALLH